MKVYEQKGFTLIELFIVITVISIITFIAVPLFVNHSDRVKKVVCETNRAQVERLYEVYSMLGEETKSNTSFDEFLQLYYDEVKCPDGGEIYYMDGEVKCERHGENDGSGDDGNGGGVPFL